MKSLAVKLITIVATVLLIGSIVYSALNIYSMRERNEASAHRHFLDVVDEASLLFTEATAEKNAVFSLLRKQLRDYDKLRSLILYDTDGMLHYAYGRDPGDITFSSERTDGLRREAVLQPERPKQDTVYLTAVPVETGLPFSITARAVYEILPDTTLFSGLKLLLLTLTGLMLILATALALLPADRVAARQKDDFYSNESGIPQVPSEYYAAHTPPVSSAKERRSESGFPLGTGRDASTEESPAAGTWNMPRSGVNETGPAVNADVSAANDGFFSAGTHLVKADFFLPRLESELKRAASFDQDLSLLLLRCPNANSAAPFASLAEKTTSFFSFHDLIFELADYSIGVILPNSDLDEGISQCSEFQRKLFEDGASCNMDVRFGLSSRNGRLVEAQRVYQEASISLTKAEKDTDHPSIVGFRPDPSKYRSFLSNKQ